MYEQQPGPPTNRDEDPKHYHHHLTVIVPAYNEAASIGDTIRSLQSQTCPPRRIIVVDDCSTDGTGDIARALDVTVLRPPRNTGTKAGAQNYALQFVDTEFVMAIDADTTLAPDGIERLLTGMTDPRVAAACGFVVPRYVRTIWERGRYIEYLLAFTFYKPIQDYFGKPMIASGCFSVYRMAILKQMGGWPTRTMAEDMDLTWSFHAAGYGVRFISDAVCYPIEPNNFIFMRKQLKRWSHGLVQNLKVHWSSAMRIPYLNSAIAVTVWDSLIATVIYLFVLPLLALIFANPLLLLGYVIDAPMVLVPVLVRAASRREVLKALASYPAFFVLRLVNSIFMLEAFWSELVMRRTLTTYEKGH
jgi:poly-beta-1,6-N-acetyl-D-glucosamine synthase